MGQVVSWRRLAVCWSQWPFPSPLLGWEGDPRDAMASVLPPVGTPNSSAHFGVVGSGPLPHGAENLA